jgi:hypothetical protein
MVLAARNCPQCGTSNPDNAKFCKNCGYAFPARPAPRPRPQPQIGASAVVEDGVVRITSTPSGAAVSIDGSSRGATPLTLDDLEPGRYGYRVSRSGYRSYSGTFTVREVLGSVLVTTTPPGAEILLDGDLVGVAGDSGIVIEEVRLGAHTVVARLEGYDDEVRTLVLSRDEPVAAAAIQFRDKLGYLLVESDPLGAAVELNGERVGTTRYFGKLVPASYDLRLTYPGFNAWKGDATVSLRDTAYVLATLSAIRVRQPALLWVGLAGLAAGAAGAVMGELTYSQYQDAAPPEYTSDEIARMRQNTQIYDWVRNVGGGLGVLGLLGYLVF